MLDDDGIGGVGMLEELWLADWQANILRLMPPSTNSLDIVKDGFFITDYCCRNLCTYLVFREY